MSLRMSVLNLGRYPPSRLIDLAHLQEECGYETFGYTDERFFHEVYTGLTLVALHTQRSQVGTMATDPYTRHPALTAMALASLDEITSGWALLGLGAGVSGFAEMHIVRHKPVQAMRETVTLGYWAVLFVRALVVHPAGYVLLLAHSRRSHCCLRYIPALSASGKAISFGAAVPRPARSPAYASPHVFPRPAQGSLPAGQARP